MRDSEQNQTHPKRMTEKQHLARVQGHKLLSDGKIEEGIELLQACLLDSDESESWRESDTLIRECPQIILAHCIAALN